MKPDASRGAGRTPLFKSIELCGRCNGAQVFVKDESKNPFGTFKDRRCAALLEHYSSKKELVFVHITSGNSGYSLGKMAKEEERKTGKTIRVVNIVPQGSSPKTIEKLKTCSTVIVMDLGEHITMEKMRDAARKATGYSGPDSNIVGVEDYGLANGYGRIVLEIYEEGLKPDFIFCPVGEGELLVEMARQAEMLWGTQAPHFVGVTIPENVLSKGKEFDPNPGKSIADKLVNGYSKFRGLIEKLVGLGQATLIKEQSQSKIASEYMYLNGIGINAEPSAAVAFLGARHYGMLPSQTAVVINTGKGSYDESSVTKVWKFRLKRALKTAAVLAAGAFFTLMIKLGADEYQDYKRHQHWQLANEVALIAENGWGIVMVDREKVRKACRALPDMDAEKCGQVYATYDLTERQLRYLVTVNKFDKDNVFRSTLPLFHEWYTKYPGWMPGEEWPETFEIDRMGFVIPSSRKPKPEYAPLKCPNDKNIRLPPSLDWCP